MRRKFIIIHGGVLNLIHLQCHTSLNKGAKLVILQYLTQQFVEKYNMLRNLTILIVVFLFGFRGGDGTQPLYQIDWREITDMQLPEAQLPLLNFVGAEFPDHNPLLPYFTHRITTQNDQFVEISFRNPRYRRFDGKLPVAVLEQIEEMPITHTANKRSGEQTITEWQMLPIVKRDEHIYLLEQFDLVITPSSIAALSTALPEWKSQSLLSSGKWVKIKTNGKGIHKIRYEQLLAWGFSSPERVNLYGSGGYQLNESLDAMPVDDLSINKIWHGKDASGRDCLFFYATGNTRVVYNASTSRWEHHNNLYSQQTNYFLHQSGTSANLVDKAALVDQPASVTVNSFDEYAYHETEAVNLIRSGRHWFGERFLRNNSRTISISTPNPVPSESAKISINAAGRSSAVSSLNVTINGTAQQPLLFAAVNTTDETTLYASERKESYQSPPLNQKIDFILNYTAQNNLAEAHLDYIALTYRRQLQLQGDQLIFRDTRSTGQGRIAHFQLAGSTSATRVFDITQPTELFEVTSTFSGNGLSFIRPSDTLREYVAFNPSGNFPEVEFVEEVANQNLHGLPTPEFIIITHPDFLSASTQIANFHRNLEGMHVEIVTTAQVYNEFGNGQPDATAIRNFIRMLYDRSKTIKYAMLVGDGSFDNRNITGANKAFVPTYQSANSLLPTSSFVTDDFFVILDPGESVLNGTVDLGIGRLPVSTLVEAATVTDKIVNYYSESSLGNWRNVVAFIGDDEDGGLHMSDSERLANLVNDKHKSFITEKIYFDAFPASYIGGKSYPGVTEAINRRVREGALILNYVGHGNERFLADERVLDISTINAWTNRDRLPVFVTATCEFSRFDATENSAGEYILFNPNGGGIGLFSTTRVVFAYSNYLLSRSFYQTVFQKNSSGERYRMGDIMRLAKINTINTINKRNFTLLANPALRLAYPRYQVVTKTINGSDANATAIMTGALSKVTITGEITDDNGNRISGFNGTITPVVYDKAQFVKSLGNGGQTPVTYKTQQNIIYSGPATVTNGVFTFSFHVPKDISYASGNGRILYYADNGTDDASGAFENFLIAGSAETSLSDNRGPDIQLFINNTDFVPGAVTGRNPTLLAQFFDESGINTVGTGIGHDITLVVNNNQSNIIVLNSYYKAAIDDYTRGSLEYSLGNLPVGKHSLRVKAWDIANNSSEAEIDFEITSDFYIESAMNYPNPLTDYTHFVFTHNQPDASMPTQFEIFDVSGRLVDRWETIVPSFGMKSAPVRWSLSEKGLQLPYGIYMYRIVIRSPEGQYARYSSKMVIGR